MIALRADAEPLATSVRRRRAGQEPRLARRRCRSSPASFSCPPPLEARDGRPRPGEAGWGKLVALAYARAALAALECALDLLLDNLREDLRARPSNSSGQGRAALHTHPAFGPAVRAAFDIPADAKQLTKLEAGVLMAVAMFQPVTRGEITEMFGREISRDLIASLRDEGLIAAGPRSPKIGAPSTPTSRPRSFCSSSGSKSLREVPDLAALKDAGLLPASTIEVECEAVHM